MELEQMKDKYAQLEAQAKKDVAERDKTITDLQAKVEKYEKTEKDRIETERKEALKTAGEKIDKLIEDKKVEPKNRETLMADFTTLYDNHVKDADKYIFGRFETKEPIKNELKQNEVVIEKETIDYSTEEGREKLIGVFESRSKELAKESGGKKTANQCYEQAQDEVCEQYGIDKSNL